MTEAEPSARAKRAVEAREANGSAPPCPKSAERGGKTKRKLAGVYRFANAKEAKQAKKFLLIRHPAWAEERLRGFASGSWAFAWATGVPMEETAGSKEAERRISPALNRP